MAVADGVRADNSSFQGLHRRNLITHAALMKCLRWAQAKTDEIDPLATVVHGRHQDAKQHLEILVELLQDPVAEGPMRTPVYVADGSDRPGNCGAQAVALGNLGVVCRELGDADGASRMMEASLESALSAAARLLFCLGVEKSEQYNETRPKHSFFLQM